MIYCFNLRFPHYLGIEHIFTCLLRSLVLPGISCLCALSILLQLFIIVIVICRSNFCIITINPSFPICVANIFSQIVTSLLTLLIVSFVKQEFLIFNKPASLLLYVFQVGILFRKSFLTINYYSILLYFPLDLCYFIFYVQGFNPSRIHLETLRCGNVVYII